MKRNIKYWNISSIPLGFNLTKILSITLLLCSLFEIHANDNKTKKELKNRLSDASIANSGVLVQNTISGKVTDGSGLPVPGVNVAVKGTTNSTQTDIDGSYSINAKKGDVLVFTFIGMDQTT